MKYLFPCVTLLAFLMLLACESIPLQKPREMFSTPKPYLGSPLVYFGHVTREGDVYVLYGEKRTRIELRVDAEQRVVKIYVDFSGLQSSPYCTAYFPEKTRPRQVPLGVPYTGKSVQFYESPVGTFSVVYSGQSCALSME